MSGWSCRLAASIALLSAAPAAAADDGARAFALQCGGCHGAKSTPAGPSLAGVSGANIAARSDFSYSAGLKAKAKEAWSDTNLDAYLKAPTRFAPGTRMFFTVPADETRAAIVKHLKTLK